MKSLFSILLTLFIYGCGGGGGSDNSSSESIYGTATGTVTATDITPLKGQLFLKGSSNNNGNPIFSAPNSLIGNYGTFTFNTSDGSWTYTVNPTKTQNLAVGSIASDTLAVRSFSGIATSNIVITITGNNNGSGGSQTNSENCPNNTLDDVWLNNRLSCLSVGQLLFKDGYYATYPIQTDTTSDLAITINEQAYGSGFTNILGSNVSRYFKYFLCIKNAPEISSNGGNWFRSGVPSDLSDAVGGGNFSTSRPPGIAAMYFGSTGGKELSSLRTTCDSSKHPLIVDYLTKKIVSINPVALQSMEIYDY